MSRKLEENLETWAAPVLDEMELSVYDVEVSSGKVRLVVDRPGGVGLDDIARCTRGLSPILDEHDPIGGHYTLEVSSPGLERKLRTVAHRRGAVGEHIKCKARNDEGETYRIAGILSEVTEGAMVIRTSDGPVTVPHGQVTSARTVFEWPEGSSTKGNKSASRTAGPRAKRSLKEP